MRFLPRRRRFWIFLLLAIVLAWGGFATWSYYANQSLLNQAIAETDALDPRWRLADMIADLKPIPDSENSALVILAGHRHLNNLDIKMIHGAEEVSDQEFDKQNRCFNGQQKAALAALVQMHEPALIEYRKIASMPYGQFPFTWNPMAQGSQSTSSYARKAIYALRYDQRDRLAEGDFATADQRMLAIVNVARSLSNEPIPITIIIRCSMNRIADFAVCEWLAKSEPSETILSQVQKGLETESAFPLATSYAQAVRATGFESLEQMPAPPVPPATNPWAAIQSMVGSCFSYTGFIRRQQAYHLKMMNRVIEITSDPEYDQLNQLAICKNNLPQDAILARLDLPAVEKILTSIHRAHASQRCTIAALAAEQFRIKNQRWPDSLNELVTSGFLKTIPLDPFDGQPLRYKATENGKLIYSIGQDRQDNNGAFDPEKSTDPGNDIIFRLYDPAQRRLPPLPPKPKPDEPKDQ